MAAEKEKKGKIAFSAGPVASQHDERVATVMGREAYSRERYEFLLRVIFSVMAMLAVSVLLNVYLALRPEKFRYFASNPEGGITELEVMEKPIQSTGEILNWTSDVLTKAFTLSFANYQSQLDDYHVNFTDDGWSGFKEALKRQKLLDTIITQQVVTTAIPTQAPVILNQGIVDGNRYGWRLQVPILMTFETASSKSSQQMTVEVVVVRRPESENPKGLGVAQIVTR